MSLLCFFAQREGFGLACGLGQGRLRQPFRLSFTTDPFESLFQNLQKQKAENHAAFCYLFWRRERDSNPRGGTPNAFRVRLVMTASISLHIC